MSDNKPSDHALRQAERAAKRGDLAAAERWTKVATLNQKQWQQFQARPAQPSPEDDEDAIREELKRRLARFSTFSHAVYRWEVERDLYIEAVKRAEETGAAPPPPLRPHPAGESNDAKPQLVAILQAPEPDDGL